LESARQHERLPTGFGAKDERLIVGLMSGSSLDGIDAALVRVEGCCEETRLDVVHFVSTSYTDEQKQAILQLFDLENSSIEHITLMHEVLGEFHAEAALAVIDQAGKKPSEVDLISAWTQAVYHLPTRSNPREILGYHTGGILMLGNLNVIAERTGVTAVGAYCSRDIAAGGNGAPFTGLGDYIQFHDPTRNRAIQNIGGIANVSMVPAKGGLDAVIGFDTGPGNMLIDSIVRHLTSGRLSFDEDGRMAMAGTVHREMLDVFLKNPFIQREPPKATGREDFGEQFTRVFLQAAAARNLQPDDIVATATALTAESIALNYERFIIPHAPIHEMIVGGGGALNPALMEMLRARLEPIPVAVDEDYGISSFAKEAIYMTLLGNEVVRGHANNVPSVTGASRSLVAGLIAPAYRDS
jgi:anhydro-N-acetylmuramic acid kinase